jgi:hypothetical protein
MLKWRYFFRANMHQSCFLMHVGRIGRDALFPKIRIRNHLRILICQRLILPFLFYFEVAKVDQKLFDIGCINRLHKHGVLL